VTPKQAYARKIEALEALRSLRSDSDAAVVREQLRGALSDRSNYLVAKAAAIATERKAEELLPELLAAFDRFFTDPVKSDPQCLAKNAIAGALKDLGHRGAQAYLRGIGHFQFEPAWGGRADTAATLRGTCALALTACQLDDLEILTHLTDALADAEKVVRINSAIAIEQLGRPEGALLLRLKLLSGDQDPEVLGQCFTSLLSLAPDGGVSFISRFLKSPNEDVQLEAASALAQCHDPRAIKILEEFWREQPISVQIRHALLISLGGSPVLEAAEFLLSVVTHDSADFAASAIAALAASRFRADMRERVEAAVLDRDSPHLESTFGQEFGPIGQGPPGAGHPRRPRDWSAPLERSRRAQSGPPD
jgi:HEAT repeat protein